MTSTRQPQILIADDERFVREMLADFFESVGCAVQSAPDLACALAQARETHFDAALVDLRMPDGTGIDLLTQLRAIDPALPVIMITGYATEAVIDDAKRLGAHDFFAKPFRLETLKSSVDRALLASPGAAGPKATSYL